MNMNLKCITSILNSINDRTQLTAEDVFVPIHVTTKSSLNLDEFTDDNFSKSLTYCVDEELVELSKDSGVDGGYLILNVTKKGQQFLQQNT